MAGIAIRGLSKSFGARDASFAAVADLDLEIKDNSFVTLLGPSGCGKTTTLRLIAGYIVPDKGTIEVDGRVLSSPGAVVSPEARGMGMVFQNYAVWPHKTVFENVVFGLKLRRIPTAAAKKQVETALALVNLSGLEGRYPNELSGGQQQRVALARSLVVEPSILLLDEPLSNLDAKLRERMRTELKELQRRTGITFVYVTHDQAEALALSDHVAVMSGGRLQQYGTPFEVYAHPANRMVADFMGLVNLVPGKVRALANGGGTVEISPDLTLDVAALDGLKPGESVDVAIRPENIRLTALASEASGQRGDSQVRAHSASEDARERADDTRPEPGSTARAAPAGGAAKLAKITNHVFLGNINEYYATLPSGQMLRVQTHPLQHFKIGEEVAVEVDATQCSVFRGATTGHTT
jgi:iron(III) transport system ATP-binding protein